MPNSPLTPLDRVSDLLEAALATSPADFTELIWLQQVSHEATTSPRKTSERGLVTGTLIATVQERGRLGMHRTDSLDPNHLQDAIRHALAQSKISPPRKRHSQGKAKEKPRQVSDDRLFDPNVSHLAPSRARELLGELVERGERARLDWIDGRVAVLNSKGLRQKARATQATLFVTSGRGTGAGTARTSARALKALRAQRLMERARQRRTQGNDPEPADSVNPQRGRLVFSPEAAASLLEEWARVSLVFSPRESATIRESNQETSSQSEGIPSFHQRHEGQSIFSPWLNLTNDPGEKSALPFPFDLRGSQIRPTKLVKAGVLQGLPARFSQVEDWVEIPQRDGFQHIRMHCGDSSGQDLLEAADGGLFISSIPRLSTHDPVDLVGRLHLRGVRRISGGQLTEAVPDFSLEAQLGELLAGIQFVGMETACRTRTGCFLGGVTAPGFMTLPPRNLNQEAQSDLS